MQVSTSTFFRRQTESMAELKTQSAELQQEIATGKNVVVPSDDPVAFSEISVLKSRLLRLDQYVSTIDSAKQRLSDEESTLSEVNNAIIRLQELNIQASTDTNSADDRRAIGKEVAGIYEMLLSFANTKDFEGGTMFGGYRAAGEAFSKKFDGSIEYNGDTGRLERTISDETQMEISSSGSEIFMSIRTGPSEVKSLFDIVKGSADALANGESPSEFSGDLKAALDHITGYQAIAGARLSRLETQTDILQDARLATRSRLSMLEDTDFEQAITELKQKLMSIDASQASFAKIADLSLFNYIK